MVRTYLIHSETLAQDVRLLDGGNGYIGAECADGVVYSPEEIRMMKNAGADIERPVHQLKKVFDGTIISVRPYTIQERYEKRALQEQKESEHE